jgi:tyrosyl-tRNA synthetase
LKFLDVITLMSKITVQRMIERDDFSKRIKASTPIYLHECLYPLMQGRDSVEIAADVELGGSEQLFSLTVGRDLQRDAGQEPQICLTMPILRGTDGTRKMGKSLGNYIGVAESAYDMVAKTMSIPDGLLREWFELLTDRPAAEIVELLTDPMAAKVALGKDIARFYHADQAAEEGAAEWRKRFSERQDPTDIQVVRIPASELVDGKMPMYRLLVLLGFAKSNNEARRAVQQGGVTIGPEREKITDPVANISVTEGLIIRVGNRRVARVALQA